MNSCGAATPSRTLGECILSVVGGLALISGKNTKFTCRRASIWQVLGSLRAPGYKGVSQEEGPCFLAISY